MIFNNSMLRLNVSHKGLEIGFAPFETKNLTRHLSEKDEIDLASKYGFLIFKPNKKKAVKKIEETIENSNRGNSNQLSDIIEKAKENIVKVPEESPTADYTTKDSIVIAQKETVIRKESDIDGIVEGKETIQLSKPIKKTKIDLDGEDKKKSKPKKTAKKTTKKSPKKKDSDK